MVMPIHRHRGSSEPVVCIHGRFEEYFYDENGALVETADVALDGVVLIVLIRQWHSIKT